MAIEVTPLGFKKPDGNELVKGGDNAISDNAQLDQVLHTEARANIANLLNAAGFTGEPLALNDSAVAQALTAGPATSTAFDQALDVKVPPVVADYIANDPSVVQSAATMAQSTEGLVPVWKASIAYTAGQKAIAPNGDIVTRIANGTSGATYDATEAAAWNGSGQDVRLGKLESNPKVNYVDGLAYAKPDAAGNRTWIEANSTDGGPSPFSLGLWRAAQLRAEERKRVEGLSYAKVDAAGNRTWIEANDRDGGPSRHGLAMLARRAGTGAVEFYRHKDGTMQPAAVKFDKVYAAGSSMMENMHAPLKTAFREHGVEVYGDGDGGSRLDHVAATTGAIPAKLTFPSNTIPAGTAAVQVTVSNVATSLAMRSYKGWASGIYGTLGTLVQDPSTTADPFIFTRATAGSEVVLTGEVDFIPEVGPQHRSDTMIFWPSWNSLFHLWETGLPGILTMVDKVADWTAPQTKRMLWLGEYCSPPMHTTEATRNVAYRGYNKYLRDTMGPLFIDLEEYFASPQVWEDTGLTPTTVASGDNLSDVDSQAAKVLPPSLTNDNLHLSPVANTAVINLIKGRFQTLGWL